VGAMQNYGLFPVLLTYMAETGRWLPQDLLRYVTYPFIHLGFTHMIMVLVFLLALGKMVGEIMGSFAVFVIFFGSAILGALVLSLITASEFPLVGGYPAVYGLVGGYTFLLQTKFAAEGAPQARAFTLIGFLLFIQLVFGVLFGTGPDWIAEIAGFVAGYGLSFLLVPEGFKRILHRLRNR
jgi:membrane associated rhomboid family serine protease